MFRSDKNSTISPHYGVLHDEIPITIARTNTATREFHHILNKLQNHLNQNSDMRYKIILVN